MNMIGIIRHGQITLPVEFQSTRLKSGAGKLKEGSYLEIGLEKDRIVLKPTIAPKKSEAIRRLHQLCDNVQSRNEGITEEEVERDIFQAIQAVRESRKSDAV